jgi:meso-butanediol dehydrogenase/(S,S)-butanediol dehydrogenase/diacetyl reductase
MEESLKGKNAVVTGASRGLGRAISEALAAQGARVAMLARGEAELMHAAASITNALPLVCDLTDPNAVRVAFATIERSLGGADILINNAAVASPQPVEEADDRLAQLDVATNILAPLYCMRSAIASMRRRGAGDIINVSSESVHTPYPFLSLYAATKAALETLTAGLRIELRGSNIRVAVFRSGRVAGTISRNWPAGMAQRARTAARESGFYASAGHQVPVAVPAKAIVDLVLLPREARVDMMELRSFEHCLLRE